MPVIINKLAKRNTPITKTTSIVTIGTKHRMYGEHMPEFKPRKSVIPKGCKRYYFDPNGNYQNEPFGMFSNYRTVYSCIAMSKQSAVKKFNKNYKKD